MNELMRLEDHEYFYDLEALSLQIERLIREYDALLKKIRFEISEVNCKILCNKSNIIPHPKGRGGEDRGKCVQFTPENNCYTQMTYKDAIRFLNLEQLNITQ
jgi:hypothetical protein